MSILSVERVSRHFGGVHALTDVCFEVSEGERLAIIGPNGAGKTTLFNCLTGAPSPSSGQILFDGRDVTSMAPYGRADLGLARSYQTVSPFGNLTVEETALIAVGGRRKHRYGIRRRVRRIKDQVVEANELIARSGLAGQEDTPLRQLSYGEQRRLDLALTFAGAPRLFLLDEPSAGLTSAESKTIVSMVQEMPRDVAVVVIDHDLDVVFNVADRMIVLDHGRVIAEGSPGEIQQNERVREVYLGGGVGGA
jgi:branched-chain amino acid transport system ATP-binding protein